MYSIKEQLVMEPKTVLLYEEEHRATEMHAHARTPAGNYDGQAASCERPNANEP